MTIPEIYGKSKCDHFFHSKKKKNKVTISLAEKYFFKISVHNMEDKSLKKWSFFNK